MMDSKIPESIIFYIYFFYLLYICFYLLYIYMCACTSQSNRSWRDQSTDNKISAIYYIWI